MAEFMYLGLRMTDGVYASDFQDYFGKDVIDVYGDQIRNFALKGFMVNEDGHIYLTEQGMDLSNRVLCEFLPDN